MHRSRNGTRSWGASSLLAIVLNFALVRPTACEVDASSSWSANWDLWDDVDLIVEVTTDSVWQVPTGFPQNWTRCRVHRVLFGDWAERSIRVCSSAGPHIRVDFVEGERAVMLLRPSKEYLVWTVGVCRKLRIEGDELVAFDPYLGRSLHVNASEFAALVDQHLDTDRRCDAAASDRARAR